MLYKFKAMLFMVCLPLVISGCGQKGALYLPSDLPNASTVEASYEQAKNEATQAKNINTINAE